jgi:hypothetical protein
MASERHAHIGGGTAAGRLLTVAAVIGLALLNTHLLTARIDISPIPPGDADTGNPLAAIDAAPGDAGGTEPRSFPQTLARPLFRASRRPPEQEAPQAAASAQAGLSETATLPDSLELVGIMMQSGRAERALIRLGEASVGQWVEVGEVLQGWRLSQIDRAGILFEAEGRARRFSLFPAREGEGRPGQ